jgi:adenylate kinase
MRHSKNLKSETKSPKVIIIMGPPGSGKGSQATLLAEKLDFFYFETSGIIEKKIEKAKKGSFVVVDGKKYYFDKQKELWRTGKLFDPPLTAFFVQDEIKKLYREGRGIIFSGSPRTLYEGQKIIPLLKKLYGDKDILVISLQISAQESIFRNSHRRICELLRHPILYSKDNEKLKKCPLDGSKLIRRKGLDDPKIIKIRLEEYKERTLPVIDYFKQQGLKVIKVNGSPPPAVVFKKILKLLKI